jgi:hypothetical protein
MALNLKRITLQSIGVRVQPEPEFSEGSWLVCAASEDADFSSCGLFSQISALNSKPDQQSALLALKKLIQVAALGQPLTVHYDAKQCHECHEFTYRGKNQVVWRIRHGNVRLAFYYGHDKLIFLAGALSKRKDKMSNAEKMALEKEVKRYIDAEKSGSLRLQP